MSVTKYAAGVLPFFGSKGNKYVLLGLEFRDNLNEHFWMGFGGGQEGEETSVETACREFNEETAGVFQLPIEVVQKAHDEGRYVQYYNPKSHCSYTMYCIDFGEQMPETSVIADKAARLKEEGCESFGHVEKVEWKYFPAREVIYNMKGTLPGETHRIYGTERIRLDLLKILVHGDVLYVETLL